MEKQIFIEAMVKKLEEILGPDYKLVIDDIRKNNGVLLKAIIIKKDGVQSAPVVYLDELYNSYLNGESTDTLVKQIQEKVADTYLSDDLSINTIHEYEAVKDKVVLRVINYQKNESILREIPHMRYLDLAVTFRIMFDTHKNALASTTVSDKLLVQWGVTVNELYKVALANSVRLLPVYHARLESMLFECDEDEIDQHINAGPKLYVLTNTQGINGATSILYPDALKVRADLIESDLLILPSSLHEILYVPFSDDMDLAGFSEVVRTVNANDVREDEILSDNVYIYRRDRDILEIANVEK